MGRVLDPLKEMGLQVEEEGARHPAADADRRVRSRPDRVSASGSFGAGEIGRTARGAPCARRTSVIESEKTRDHTENMLSLFRRWRFQPCYGRRRRASHLGRRYGKPLKESPSRFPAIQARPPFWPRRPSFAQARIFCIQNVLINPTRTGFYETLSEMGAGVSFENERDENGEPVADLRAKSSTLQRRACSGGPRAVDDRRISDPRGARGFRGRGDGDGGACRVRVKESDRLAAMVGRSAACGVKAKARGDTLAVTGAPKVRGGATV